MRFAVSPRAAFFFSGESGEAGGAAEADPGRGSGGQGTLPRSAHPEAGYPKLRIDHQMRGLRPSFFFPRLTPIVFVACTGVDRRNADKPRGAAQRRAAAARLLRAAPHVRRGRRHRRQSQPGEFTPTVPSSSHSSRQI